MKTTAQHNMHYNEPTFNTSPQKQPKGRTEQENYSRDSKRGKHKPDFSSQRKQKRGE